MRRRIIAVLCFFIGASAAAVTAQDDRAAGLFAEARQLPLVSQSLAVEISGGEATVELVQVFANNGLHVAQADYRLHLPDGAGIDGFGFWNGDRFLAAELKERQEATRAHHRAASEGRATGLLKRQGTIHSFSVYPVGAGELKRIETRLRLPVATERGRNHLRLPIDSFLGQAAISSAAVVRIHGEEPLRGWGVEGRRWQDLGSDSRTARFALSSRTAVELWWSEEAPPLLTRAEAVSLDDGRYGLQLRVVLNDAAAWYTQYEELHLIVDSSFSMRRRSRVLTQLIDRVLIQAATPVLIHAVADEIRHLPPGVAAQDAVELLFEVHGHGSSQEQIALLRDELGCDRDEVRCVVVTDPQLPGLEKRLIAAGEVLFVADAHEKIHFETALGDDALLFDEGADTTARLNALADRLVLPVLEVVSLTQQGTPLELPGRQQLVVAEGGLLRLFARSTSSAPLELEAEVAGRDVRRLVHSEVVDPEDQSGRAVRRGLFRNILAGLMRRYAEGRDEAIKKRIIELSLREQIPTAFTALQVDDPELSLTAIKPGDPLLSVPSEPGLQRVVAWYPFGPVRDLVLEPQRAAFSDRFLVPRGWRETSYRIEIFKYYDSGEVARDWVWYQLDEQGPEAEVVYCAKQREVHIHTGEATPEVGSVLIHTGDGRVLTLSPVGETWIVPAADVGDEFTVVVRDRAGNRSVVRKRLEQGVLTTTDRTASPPRLEQPAVTMPLTAEAAGGMVVRGEDVVLMLPGSLSSRMIRFRLADVPLRSLRVTALFTEGPQTLLVGTAGGDLLRLQCGQAGERCVVAQLGGELEQHPVTGFARLPSGAVLVGVLGRGLFELDGARLGRSSLRVGSRFVTGVAVSGDEILVATGYNGLWRIVNGRPIKARFPRERITSLLSTPRDLVVASGGERFRRLGRDRYEPMDAAAPLPGSADLTSLLVHGGELLAAGFDSGLLRLERGALKEIDLNLDVAERRVNAMAELSGTLWLATEGGLLRIDDDRVERVLNGAVHDLDAGPDGLAVASSGGLWVLDPAGSLLRQDLQNGVGSHSFVAVAWWHGALYAGGLEGLFRFTGGRGEQIGAAAGFDAGWVTALLADGDRLLVGTYDEGVWSFDGHHAAVVAGLEHHWVPPHGLERIGGSVWIGGLGMSPARLDDGCLPQHLLVPARDVNHVAQDKDGTLFFATSDGLMSMPPLR